ncbi:MAG: hypothetical protein Q8927_11695 [Bacteroidota bacterium]|nr:hypothetical protein [Bacteroidota bacterium]MDP4216856.1 hypothetical protein [Bacteroidota bacterium]MDP4260514.1 hypothetical protein [Bacteroidota bacterium]
MVIFIGVCNKIEKAYKNGHLICICLNRIDWQRRVIGYVKKFAKSDSFTLEVIDEFGQKKDLRTVSLSSIKSLEIGGVYIENLEKLNKNGFKRTKTRPKYISINKRNAHKKLNEFMALSTLCTFVFGTEYSVGIVTASTESEFSISNVGFDGSDNGFSVFDVNSLTQIRYEGNAEERISFLHKLANALP